MGTAPARSRCAAKRPVVLALAAAAAAAIKVPELFGVSIASEAPVFYIRNLAFFVLPFLAAYLAWKRGLGAASFLRLLVPFAATALVVNLYPFQETDHTFALAAIHLPIALWLVVGLAYVGLRWRDHDERMHFIRFSGELFIYYVLIALGGGVLAAFTAAMFQAIGLDAEALHLAVAGALRRDGRRARRRLARRGEAGRDREHGARAHADLHAALHAVPRGVSWRR